MWLSSHFRHLFFALPAGETSGQDATPAVRVGSSASLRMPAEWEAQCGVQLTWPHALTDWAPMLDEVTDCFVRIAREIAKRERLVIVAPDVEEVKSRLGGEVNLHNVTLFSCPTNDTWARDHGPLTLKDGGGKVYLSDFKFNGWGGKYPAGKDDCITRRMCDAGILRGRHIDCSSFVLEGGSVESDGQGTLMTTSSCLLSAGRNDALSRDEIETRLKKWLSAERVLWIDHGKIVGDDTDGHVDTLARLCPCDTILYVSCSDPHDEQYEELKLMEEQLCSFRTPGGKPYRLLALPMPRAVVHEGERLPATYANYLVMNGAVLYPTYGQPELDAEAGRVIARAYPEREVVGIDCSPLIRQHGSLHCVTMQFPTGVLDDGS